MQNDIAIKDMTDDMLVLTKMSFKRLKTFSAGKDENYYNLICEEIKSRNIDESKVLKSLIPVLE